MLKGYFILSAYALYTVRALSLMQVAELLLLFNAYEILTHYFIFVNEKYSDLFTLL